MSDQSVIHAVEDTPVAIVQGQPVTTVPQDLYIPPDALEVILEAFEGPLDLLLYLIKKQNLDILDIPISEITTQYMEYVDLIKDVRLELAADYLVMAAMLAEIKSRMLLPRKPVAEEEDDPRAELVRRLQEYERIKTAAENIDAMPRMHRDFFPVKAAPPSLKLVKPLPTVDRLDILFALKDVLTRSDMFAHHHVQKEGLSVRECMSRILDAISDKHFTEFKSLFILAEGRMGIITTLLALLELIKEATIELVQTKPYGDIHVKVGESCQ